MTYPWKSVNANVAPWVILVDELSHWLGCLVYGMNHLMMIAWWTCLHVISPWGGRLSRLLSIYYCCFYFPFFHCWSHRRFDGKLSYVDNQVKGNTIHCKSFLSNQNHQNVETFENKHLLCDLCTASVSKLGGWNFVCSPYSWGVATCKRA